MLKWHYRNLFLKYKTFKATLYLETKEANLKPTQKVHVIGSFTQPPWIKRIPCTWDNKFKCFKADKVKIKKGSHFKFVLDDGKLYLNS